MEFYSVLPTARMLKQVFDHGRAEVRSSTAFGTTNNVQVLSQLSGCVGINLYISIAVAFVAYQPVVAFLRPG
jgi:hypothetical protein